MALVLGELSTILSADDKPLEQGLDKGKQQVRQAGVDMERIARITGQNMGEEIAEGAAETLRDERRQLAEAGRDAGDQAGGQTSEGFTGKLGPMLRTGMLAIGAAAGAALGLAITKALDADAAKAKLAAQLGGDAEYAADMGRIAGKVYLRGFGESAAAVNETLRAVITSGLVAEDAADADIERLTLKAQQLADVFGQDVTATARAAGQMIRTGLAKNADEAFDLLTRGFQESGDHAGDLLDTISEYSTKFRDLGLDGAQALGLVQQGLKAGARDADTVADALKEFAIRSIDGTKAVADGYKALGLDAEKMATQIGKGGDGARKGLDTVLDRLRAIKDPVERDAAAVALFGTKAEDLGDALYSLDVDGAVNEMGKVGGAADKMGKTLEDSASHKVEAFKRNAMQKLTDAGGAIIGLFEKVAANPKVREFLGDVKDFLDEDVIPVLRKFWRWLEENVGPVLAKLADQYLSQARDALEELRDSLKDNEPELKQFVGWLEKIAKFILEKVIPAVGPALTAGLATAIRAVKLASENLARMVRVINTIRGAVSGAVSWVTSRFNSMVSYLRNLPGRIRGAASGMFNGVKDAFRQAINWIVAKWNNLSFSLPAVSTPFGSIGGATLNTPDIPYLAQGGIVPATPAGRLVRVAEAGEDEAVAPLSRLAPMIRDAVADAGAGGGDTYVYVEIDGEQLQGRIVRTVRDEGRERDRQLKRRVTSGTGVVR